MKMLLFPASSVVVALVALPVALCGDAPAPAANPLANTPAPAAVTSPEAPDRALFQVNLGVTKIDDPLPDVPLLVEGQTRRLASFAGRPLVLCLVFNAIPADAYVPKMDALAARYGATYGVQTVVVKINTTESDYREWLKTGPVSFLRGWDPAGRFTPTGPETAQMEYPLWEMNTMMRTIMGAGTVGTPMMPAYIVVSAEGKLVGWLNGHKWFEDGMANLLIRAGVSLAAEHQPKFVASAEDFQPVVPREPDEKVTVGQPMPKIEFTDLNGKRVSLEDLRGRVVLIDFWATWCGPCKEEIPNVKKVFAAYHDKGFEVIGIALENAGLRPGDTPTQSAAKLEKAKKILADFIASSDMPWPQYFDGKHWKNDIAKRFGIGSIPAMFLIDQQGKVVSTNARGEKLEAEVKHLLGL